MLVALLWATSAWSQELQREVQMDIAAQPLAAALIQFSSQTGVQVITRAADVAPGKSAGVAGRMSIQEALKRLLAGTGFSYVMVGDSTVEIQLADALPRIEDAAGAEPDTPPAQSLMDAGAPVAETPVSTGGRGKISGQIVDAASGTFLRGALVRVLETGATTQADALGQFHVRGLAPGEYTLSVSYLGYGEKHWRVAAGEGDGAMLRFSLEESDIELSEVTVFGTRSARALALNQQRTAENSSSVVSADMLGNFTGTTISEALRRVEGVAMVRDAATGDGSNVVLRGLEPNLNQIKLNGLSLPGHFRSVVNRNDAADRSADMSFLLADSVATITVNKTLLPRHDSAGTGGLIEIETKSPLDRPHRFANFTVEGGRKGKDFGEDFLAGATVSGTFGAARNFGLSASAQYRNRSTRNVHYLTQLTFGPFQPLAEDGTPLDGYQYLDPRLTWPFDPEANRAFPTFTNHTLQDVDSSGLTVTLGAAWALSDRSSIRFDVTRATDTRDTFTRTSDFVVSSNPELAPIAALNGEVRQLNVWDGAAGSTQRYSATRDVESVSDTVSLSGKTTRGKFDFDYTLGYVRGKTKNPKEVHFMMFHSAGTGFDPAWVDSRAIDPIEGRIISPYGERTGRGYPLPFLTEEGFAHFNDVDNYVSPFGQLLAGEGFDRRGTGEASVRFDAGGRFFKYLEAGVNFEQATFWTEPSDSFDFFAACLFCPVSDLGLAFDEPGLAAIGQRGGFSVASRANFESFADRLDALAGGPEPLIEMLPVVLDPRTDDQFTRENNLATYVQARFDFGRLEVIGGVRLSRVEAQTVRLQHPEFYDQDRVPDQDLMLQFTRLLDLSAVSTDILPRVLLNYRQSDKLIFRGGYFLTTARPGVLDLSQEQFVSLSLWPFEYHDLITGTDHPLLHVTQGNPGLEPTVTHNLDLSAEYYHDQIGLMRISGFYKRSDNLIETNETILRRGSARAPGALDGFALPDHPSFDPATWPDNLVVQTSIPVNSEDPAHLWGIEVGVERQLTFLPGIWSGLGVYANVAYTSGSKTEKLIWYHPDVLDDEGNVVQPGFEEIVKKRGQPYGQQSAYTGTASLTYNKYGIDATLAYSLQARALSGFQGFGLADFSEEVGTLDLKIARRFATSIGTFTVSLEGADLLKGTSSPDLESSVGSSGSTGKFYTEGGFIGGRQFRLGVGASF